jgi:hypothetical protein
MADYINIERIEQKLQAIEVLIKTIRDDYPRPANPAIVVKKKAFAVKPTAKTAVKPTMAESPIKRFTPDEFIDFVRDNSYEKTFYDGIKRLYVRPTLDRKKWPLDVNNNEYLKLQDLCADFNYECIRDDPSKKTVYIVVPVTNET